VIGHFTLTHKRFAVGPKPTAVSAVKQKRKKKPVVRGTTFTFTLSEAATTRIAITEKVKGHRASRKRPCRAPPRPEAQLHPHHHPADPGASAQPQRLQPGRVLRRYAKKHLAKGTYTATATATDAAKNRSKSRSVTFIVVG
jgi:hypothetical protein